MRRFFYATAIAGLLAATGTLAPTRADAAMSAAAPAIARAAVALGVVDTVQFFYNNHRYCWYAKGWRGTGWYWCGYEKRVGLGWGGPLGYRGWINRPAPVVAVRPRVPSVVVSPPRAPIARP